MTCWQKTGGSMCCLSSPLVALSRFAAAIQRFLTRHPCRSSSCLTPLTAIYALVLACAAPVSIAAATTAPSTAPTVQNGQQASTTQSGSVSPADAPDASGATSRDAVAAQYKKELVKTCEERLKAERL